jgi:CubicO group peptidase (beta-lactamase class C family)
MIQCAPMSPQLRRLVLPVVAVLFLALAGIFGPSLWRCYLGALASRSAPLYAPRERVTGGNEPLAPWVDPPAEQLESQGLEEAARYAAAHGSRALIVARHDHIVFERYWQGTAFDTLSDAQGFTPLLAVLAMGTAIQHRRVGWPDEPLSLLLSEWSADPRGAITVRNLLQQSSGLAAPEGLDEAHDLSAAALASPLSAPPGTLRFPQPVDSQLLALALERATQQRYAQYLSATLWRRLGAADAWLWLDEAGMAHADCCMFARQGDWIRLGQMLARDGNYRGAQVMRPGWVDFMRIPAKSDPEFGSLVRIALHPPAGSGLECYASADTFVVEGRGGNRLWIVPSLQLAILATGDARGRDAQWDDARIPNLVMRAARDYLPPAARPGADLSTIVPGH